MSESVQSESVESGAAQNTDREIWRERPGDYYADSIHVSAEGGIGINCGGSVVVLPVREWHRRALAAPAQAEPVAWLIQYGEHRTVHLHNAVADYRQFAENVTSTPLYAHPPADEAMSETKKETL